MKPRLQSAAITIEDRDIRAAVWTRFSVRHGWLSKLNTMSDAADRRDADLMYRAVSTGRGWSWLVRDSGRHFDYWGGAPLSAKAINPHAACDITYFA